MGPHQRWPGRAGPGRKVYEMSGGKPVKEARKGWPLSPKHWRTNLEMEVVKKARQC